MTTGFVVADSPIGRNRTALLVAYAAQIYPSNLTLVPRIGIMTISLHRDPSCLDIDSHPPPDVLGKCEHMHRVLGGRSHEQLEKERLWV